MEEAFQNAGLALVNYMIPIANLEEEEPHMER